MPTRAVSEAAFRPGSRCREWWDHSKRCGNAAGDAMKRAIVFAGMMVLLLSVQVRGAEGPRSYTLADCLRIGRDRAARAANARRDVISARAGIQDARAEALPHLDLKGDYTRLDEVPSFDLADGPVKIGTENNYGVSAELSQALYKGGQVRAALRAAKAYERFARHGNRMADAMLDRDIGMAFHGVLLAEAEAAVEGESVTQLQRLVAQSEARFRQQTIPEFELLSARVRLANALPRQIAASNRLEVARESLRTLACLDDGACAFEGTLSREDVSWTLDEIMATAMTNRPELARMKEQVRLHREDIQSALSAYRPTIRAFGNYRGANSSAYAPMQTEWDWHWTAGVTAEWALVDGGRRAAVTLQKRLALENALAELEDMRRAVALEARRAFLDLTHAREAIRVAGETVALAERGLAIAAVRHEQGVSTYLEFTETNLALSTARLQKLQAMHAYTVACMQVRYAAGLPIEEGKERNEPEAK